MKKEIPTNSFVFKQMEELAPLQKAYSWDNVGLQIGSYNKKAEKIMITLDVLESVADEAADKDVDLIIAHHPLLFKPLKRINLDTPKGRTISKLLRHDITVYAAHTNLDVVEGGVNDMLSERLELVSSAPLVTIGNEKLYKYAVHVPVDYVNQLKQVIGDAGGGTQGDYTHCSFEIEGTGNFKPVQGADPFIGKVGEITSVDEVKIEALVEESKLNRVVTAVQEAHPYEEPAFDIIPLANEGKTFGLGRIGEIEHHVTLEEFTEKVKEKLNLSYVRIVGDLKKKVEKVAVVGGSGGKYISDAKRAGADVYITGDVGFHEAQEAMEMGLAVIDAGHYIEEIMKENIRNYLKVKLSGYDVEIITSEKNTDPFRYF